ncbi:MAG: hypothetical protein V7L22_18530 [Nostoc sp.]
MSQFQRCKQTYTQTNVTGSQRQAVISDLTCAALAFSPPYKQRQIQPLVT